MSSHTFAQLTLSFILLLFFLFKARAGLSIQSVISLGASYLCWSDYFFPLFSIPNFSVHFCHLSLIDSFRLQPREFHQLLHLSCSKVPHPNFEVALHFRYC